MDKRFSAGVYDKCDESTLKAMQDLARLEGVILDPVYTGKGATGLLAMAGKGNLVMEKMSFLCIQGDRLRWGLMMGSADL